jgi:MerR family transcriptional regulator, thiopeptide resistance regulator
MTKTTPMATTPDAPLFTVSQVAKMAHVTVRALHHYDQRGLLVPSERSAAGYRLYSDRDLERLQQILVLRQLDFSLDAIGPLIDATAFDRRQALEAQRELLLAQRRQTNAIIRGVDAALAALEGDAPMDQKKMFDGFDEFDSSKYDAEAEDRWGKTDAYKVSMRRTKSYAKDDWARIKAEEEGIQAGLAELLRAGVSPESEQAMDLAEQHRQHIDRWYYPCSPEMHVGLSDMYTADPRFEEHFEKRAAGLAAYVQTAITANALQE